ncbi:MAG: sulfur carrier protein ThiS [Candidatus Sumerlaeaceae bacterium]
MREIKLTINGTTAKHEVRSAGELLSKLNIPRERVAIVVNEQVIRRANLDETTLADGDIVEVITMVGGG